MTLDAVVAGLVGSIATVLVTKLFDVVQESRKHHYALRRTYFERKLESAEAVAQQWQIYTTASGVFEALAERWHSAPRGFSNSDVDLFGAAIWKEITDLRTASLNPARSVRLYFESDAPGFWDTGPMHNLSQHFAALEVLQARARDMQRFYGPGNRVPLELSESLAKSFAGMQSEAVGHLGAIASAYNDLARSASETLKRGRTGMRKFEP